MSNNNGLVMVIDSKPYRVNVHFNTATTENIGDKIIRLVRREVESGVMPLDKAVVEYANLGCKSV